MSSSREQLRKCATLAYDVAMPQKLTFVKVALQSFTRKPTGGKAFFEGPLSKGVISAMGWDDFPEWQKTASPAGKLIASVVELTPKQSELAKHAIELKAGLVDGFEIKRIEADGKSGKKVKAKKTVITFAVHFTDIEGAQKLEQYMQTCGESSLLVTYELEPEQENLPGTDDGEAVQEELKELVQDVGRRRATHKDAD